MRDIGIVRVLHALSPNGDGDFLEPVRGGYSQRLLQLKRGGKLLNLQGSDRKVQKNMAGV